jgi:Adenylate and Guanylate cyclase catalytic domain
LPSFHQIHRDEAVDEALLVSAETSDNEMTGLHKGDDHEHRRGLGAGSSSDASNRFDDVRRRQLEQRIAPSIQDENGTDAKLGPFAVVWQYSPISPNRSIINYNLFSNPDFVDETKPVLEHNYATLSRIHTFSHDWENQSRFESFMSEHLHHHTGIQSMAHEPYAHLHYPVHQDFGRNSSTVAILTATLYWKHYFQNVLHEGVEGVLCVIKNSVGQVFTYQMDGPEATLLGLQDLHDPSYDYMEHEGTFTSSLGMTNMSRFSLPLDEKFMTYSLLVYPSKTFEANYQISTPYIVTLSMMLLFIITAGVFKVYDFIIERRQTALLEKAAKSNDIVASLFPETVHARIMGESTEFSDAGQGKEKKSGDSVSGRSARTIGSMYDMNGVIADFYPEATVLCTYLRISPFITSNLRLINSLSFRAVTDIKGFTAWCSEREPSQVFILLETLYNTYDITAKKRKVFKVETIGGKYAMEVVILELSMVY